MRELTIGQMSDLNCVSEKTLRLYHEKGLLIPTRIEERTGYRYYSVDQCATLDMIQQLKALGFSLNRIQDIKSKGSVEYLEQAVSEQLNIVENNFRNMMIAKRVGEATLASCALYKKKPICNEVMLENCPDRRIIKFGLPNPAMANPDLEGPEALEEWELTLRYIKQNMIRNNMPTALFRHVGGIIYKENLLSRNLHIDDSYVFVEKTHGDIFDSAQKLEHGQYLTMFCDSLLDEKGAYAELASVARMLDYADKKGYEIIGDYLGEVIAETPAFQYKGRDLFYKLQIPVRKK